MPSNTSHIAPPRTAFGLRPDDPRRDAGRPPARRAGTVVVCGAPWVEQDLVERMLAAHHQRPSVVRMDAVSHADMETLRRAAPHARLVHVIRDGRNAVVGAARVRLAPLEPSIPPEMVRSLASEWARAVHIGWRGRDLFGEGYIEARRERLLAATPAHIEAMLESLGLDACEQTVSSVRAAIESDAPHVPDWRKHFTNDAKAAFKSAAGALLIELGYERDMEW